MTTPGFFVARRLTAPPEDRDFPLRVIAVTRKTVTITTSPGSENTTTPGQWGMFYPGGGHIAVSGTPILDGRTATWHVERGTPPPVGTRIAWSGIDKPTPGAAGLLARDHVFATPAGGAPAWFINANPGESHPVWAVHIYGAGSTRAGTLRGVTTASAMGLPSVVPTYRNSLEGPKHRRGRSHLGATEADDIAAALQQLSVTGEERFVLFGWSMGAQMALALAADARWAPRIDRLVLDSPVLDWRSTLAHNLARASVPAVVGIRAEHWMERPGWSRAMGLDRPLDLDSMDWVSRAAEVTQPTLILHSESDQFTPHSASQAFSQVSKISSLVTTRGGHTTGWNTDPEMWHRSVADFRVTRPI